MDQQTQALPITTITSPYYDKYQLRPYNPAELYQKFNWKVYDEMRTDDQISAILDLKKNLIVNAGFQIVCEESEEIADFIEDEFESIDFNAALYEMLSGFDYGFSLTEKTYQEKCGMIGLASLKTRAPHTFEFKQDDHGNILNVKQYGGRGGDVLIAYDRFMHYINAPEFDNPYGNSEMNRGVYTAWWSKKAIIKFWNIYLERYGSPLSVGKYTAATTEQQRSDFRDALNNLQAKTSMMLPPGFEVEFVEATKGGDGFERAIDKYNMLIARKMLVPDLMGLGGSETGGGSYALGGIQQKLFLQTLERPRRQIARLINECLVRPLCDMNFAGGCCAEFKFKPISEDVMIDKIKVLSDIVQKGLITKQDSDEKWVREVMDLPDVESEDQDLQQPGTTTPEIPIDPSQIQMPALDDTVVASPYSYALASLKYDKKVNYAKIENYLDDAQARLVASLGKIVKDSVNQLVSEVRKKNIIGKASLWSVANLSLKNFDAFRMTLKRGLKDALSTGRSDGEDEAGSSKKNIVDPQGPNVDPEEYLNDLAASISQTIKGGLLDKIKTIIREGIRNGKSFSQIMAEVDDAVKGYDVSLARDGVDGEPVAANVLETTIRTNLNTAYNEGRQEYFESTPDLIQAYQFSAVMDGRTSERCAELHGKIFKPSEARSYMPPMHYNCRSVLVPITILDDTPTITPSDEIPPKPPGAFK